VSRRRWKTEVAGLPCSIETANNGGWVVTIASTTRSRRNDLAAAIVDACGGLVGKEEALAIAASVASRLGSLMPPTAIEPVH
jgi:hypothetical protein